jgi:CHAT domain-containing protein/tetratricopeptide (TPR) repeat protein
MMRSSPAHQLQPRRSRRKAVGVSVCTLLLVAFAARAAELPSVLPSSQPDPANLHGSPLLVPGHSLPFWLPPTGQEDFLFRLKAGDYADVSVAQSEGLLWAVLSDPAGTKHTPHLLDAGKGSVIEIPVIAAKDGLYSVRVTVSVPEPGCSGLIMISAAHPVAPPDRQFTQAQNLFARAEWIRKTGNRETWGQGVHDYNVAITVARSIHNWKLLRAALTGKSRILIYRMDDYPGGHQVAGQALAVPLGGEDLPGEALAWKTFASVEYYLGNYHASIAASRKALALYKLTGDRYWQGITVGNLAYMYREIGDTEDALAAGQQALEIARSIGDLTGVDFGLDTLAAIHASRGEFEEALSLYYQSLDALRKKGYPESEADDWLGLGKLYLQLGDAGRATKAFQRAVTASEDAHDSADEIEVLGFLGDLALGQHQFQKAQNDYRRGLEDAQSKQLLPEESFLLIQLGKSYAIRGSRARAATSFEGALAIARKISQTSLEGRALQGLGDLDATSGHAAQAAAAYTQAYAIWKEEGHRGRMAVALASLARLSFENQRIMEAREEIQTALDLVETSRETLASRQLRTSYFASKHAYYELAVAILMRLNSLHPRQGYDVQALEMAERARARTLLDKLRMAIHEKSPVGLAGIPPQLVARQKLLGERLDAAYARLREELGSPATKPEALRALHSEIGSLLQESDDVEARMRESSSRYAALARGEPVPVPDLQATGLGSHTALLEYWVGERQSFLWVVRRHNLTSVTLPARSKLASLGSKYLANLLARSQYPPGEDFVRRHERVAAADARMQREALQLGNLLLGPTLHFPDIRQLLIVPDGPLWSLPFSALRIPASTPMRHGQGGVASEYALERFGMVEEPSASVFLSLMRRKPRTEIARRIAIFADPVYTAADPRVAGNILAAKREPASDITPESRGGGSTAVPVAFAGTMPALQGSASEGAALPGAAAANSVTRWVSEAGMAHLPRLPGSWEEAKEIAALAGPENSTLYIGFDAQPQVVRREEWSGYRIVHFATHAVVSTSHPAFSGIVMTMVRRDGSPVDGVLWLNEIYSLRMPLSMVVLSGCRTATGREIPGEGVEGIARAFFFAGARRVTGSLWSIEDQETSGLMQIFYRNLLRRHFTAAASLRAAQLELTRQKKWSHPYFWAGFVLQGLPD